MCWRCADNNDIVGTFYDRDYVLHLMHGAFPPDNLTVSEVMEKNVTCAQMSTPLQQCVPLWSHCACFMCAPFPFFLLPIALFPPCGCAFRAFVADACAASVA